MFTLMLQNHLGERIALTQNPNYAVVDIDGLNPPKANINTGENANFDGATFNSSRLNTRQLTITVHPLGNVEENRIALYTFVKCKKNITVFFANRSRNVYIAGYVSACEIDLFKKNEAIVITILCPDPYFRESNDGEAEFSNTIPMFSFEFAIDEVGIPFSEEVETPEALIVNYGDVETGCIIDIAAHGSATNPVLTNGTTNKQMSFTISLEDGDILRINTNKGKKSVTLIHEGTSQNRLDALDMSGGVDWLTLESGQNDLLFTAASGAANLSVYVYYDTLYEGV